MAAEILVRPLNPPAKPIVVFGVLALVLALRVMHLSSALQSPLSYQPGPDEDYYLRFGEAVAGGHGADSPEFTFMDPGYGYLLGLIFKLLGVNQFAVYLLQALLDTATAFGILTIGQILGRPRAGLYGALLYGVTSTAIMFCATLLKETCVAAYLTWWVAAALALYRSERGLAWLAFGAYCGLGVALRSTLLLLAGFGLLLPALQPDIRRARWLCKAALLFAGLMLSLMPWSARNFHADGSLSPLPHNGGIVLHQVYNPDNPESAIWIPPFVSYSHPSEIWRGYAAEAERRTGRPLSPVQVDRYWRSEALAFMRAHPADVIEHVARKTLKFLAATEVPNNRSLAEEQLFSPVLRILPLPNAWLLALGLAGLVWLATRDRRWLIIAAPIALSWLTFAVFWAEDRFRFHAVPLLAFSSGIWIDSMVRGVRDWRGWPLPACAALALLIGATSVYLGVRYPPPEVRWDHVVWGYIKMHKPKEAQVLADRVALEQPDNGPIFEALGYLAAVDGQYDEAVRRYQRAVDLRPASYLAHYNLAKALLALGRRDSAAAEARIALKLSPSPDAQALLSQAEAAP
jgi:tetratricopeptide (TPR) repeat protein